MLRSKAKLAYKIVAIRILIAKIDLVKIDKIKEKIASQNATICAAMKIENIFWLYRQRKNRCTTLLVFKVANIKMTNLLIEKRLVMNHSLYKYIRYNLICKIKECFNCYKYGHILVYFQKNTKCGAYLGPHQTSKCL